MQPMCVCCVCNSASQAPTWVNCFGTEVLKCTPAIVNYYAFSWHTESWRDIKNSDGKREREGRPHNIQYEIYRPGHKGTYLLTKHIRIHTAMTFFIESL